MFQSPRSGKFVSNINNNKAVMLVVMHRFQSPRSGKFVSDEVKEFKLNFYALDCFNPLDRGNLYQI